ncbi:GNAT family N-acetyltransferase [Christiangramia forsetii]|uniref:N-acetyltransferase domain-containing protein n=2 Tax=Christiangramia forsetii TaxID=411153 RepID=A0M2X1_CHRFK|nr:GNAT family N-acetyltransferase [Christiangramia forsetii]GGG27333.1 hypothetical protein GCM10011532_08450 [Christiangramia forsetii]CAL66966.1 hypothetical protein GFO_2001 [Christiangramia forsetii KT0803]
MEIKEADLNDIPEIVEVLKASLGEEQLELSEKVWRYKHIDNPFGSSVILIAKEDNKIVGVRAFMRWQWQHGDKKYHALRAVDTATHPNHQGKGIFKKLTLRAVDFSRSNDDNFIFNTPNEQSRPGYLKMGWEQVGNIQVGLRPSLSFLKFKKKQKFYKINKNISNSEIKELCTKWNKRLEDKLGLFNPKSPEILKWRYENNPLQKYEVIAGQGFYLAAYLKKRGKFKEFRIAEFIYDEQLLSSKELSNIINNIVNNFSCHIISYAPNLLRLSGKKGHFGPVLTFNALNISDKEKDYFLEIDNWNNSLGDLELF